MREQGIGDSPSSSSSGGGSSSNNNGMCSAAPRLACLKGTQQCNR